MLDQQSFIVDCLNKPPFSIETNIIIFDKFPDSRLLQILSDVLCWITNAHHVDVSREKGEETAVRILNALRILNFKPPRNPEEMERWRAGLIEGKKNSVYPVLFFVFTNVDQLKERCYLARFLIRVEVPSELHDVDIEQLQNDLAEMREQFKEVHFRVTAIKQETMILDEIRADLKVMENEKDNLRNKIEKSERRVFNVSNLHKHMISASALRIQRERLAELEVMRQKERDQVIHLEQTLQRLKIQLQELVTAGENIDPSHLIDQLEEEIASNNYLVNIKLADDIEEKREVVRELSKIYDMPAIDQKEINNLKYMIDEMNKKLVSLEEQRDKVEEGMEENFSVFRHQAAAIERKKQTTAQKLQEAIHEYNQYDAKVENKKREIKSRSGVDIITGKEFRDFASHVRDHSVLYKTHRKIMDDHISEREIIRSTMERLARQFDDLKEHIHELGGDVLEDVEIRVTERPKTSVPRTNDVSELRNMINLLTEKVDRMKDAVEPLKREKDEKQTQFNELNDGVREKRNMFERRKEQLERDSAQIKEEVTELEERKVHATDGIDRLKEKAAKVEENKAELESGGEEFMEKLQIQLKEAEDQETELRRNNETSTLDEENDKQQVLKFQNALRLYELKFDILQMTSLY